MIIDVNERCCIESDLYQWMALHKKAKSENDWRRIAFYRTLHFALDALIEEKLCTEPELAEARAIAEQLESAKRRINELCSGRSDAPIPDAIAGLGSFITSEGGINYWFLRQVWGAGSADEIPALAAKGIAIAETVAGNASERGLEGV